MPRNFVRKTYERWLKKNRSRFRFPPRITESRKHYFIFRFDGITPELTCRIYKNGHVAVFIHDHQGQYWDIIADFDIFERRSSDGTYYCNECETQKFYSTRSLLWEEHVFEDILMWTNSLKPYKWISLFGIPGKTGWGAEWVDIRTINLPQKNKNCFPIIVG